MVRRRHSSPSIILAFLLVFVVACAGCSPARSPVTANTGAAVATATEKDPVPSSPHVANTKESDSDPTLYPDEYEARGVPSIQNPWTVNDYQLAVEAFTAIANENPAFLPRSGSKHSGAVFRRMVSRENIAIYANRDIAWEIRKTSAFGLGDRVVKLMLLYLQSLQNGQPVDRELLEFVIQGGHSFLLMWATMDEVATVIYRNDPGLSGRMGGLDEMQLGTTNTVSGMLTMLTDREYLRLPTLLWYVPELVPIVPNLLGRLKPSQQAQLQQRIDSLAASEPERDLAKELKVLSRTAAHPAVHILPRPGNMSDAP